MKISNIANCIKTTLKVEVEGYFVERFINLCIINKLNIWNIKNINSGKISFYSTPKELEKMEQKLIHAPHIFQKFINSSFGQDFRIITIGGKYVAGMKRISKNGDFRSNIALGGEAQIIPIENPYIEMAEKVSQLLELDYVGIDILIGNNNEPIFCEANSNAFFQGIEKYSGVNIAREYAKHIFNKIYK